MLYNRHHCDLPLFTPFTHFLHICRLNAVTVPAPSSCQNMASTRSTLMFPCSVTNFHPLMFCLRCDCNQQLDLQMSTCEAGNLMLVTLDSSEPSLFAPTIHFKSTSREQ